MRIPFLRPSPPQLSQMITGLTEIEQSGVFTNYGPMNARFEGELERRLFEAPGTTLTVCNATIGLMLAIKNAVVTRRRQRARYALMPAFTFAAAAQAAEWIRLTPLLCDIEPDGWTPCPRSEERLIQRYGSQIAVIVPYATFGNCIDLERYDWLSQRYGIPVVVDAAASLGALDSRGRAFGTGFNHPIVFSMHATKAFSVGEGGIIHCADPATIRRLREMGNFGFGQPRTATMPGLNSKLSEVAALVGLTQLERYEEVVARRIALARRYAEKLPGWTFQHINGQRQVPAMMPVLPPDSHRGSRAELQQGLAQAGIGSAAYFSPHLGQQPHLAGKIESDDLPVTDRIASDLLALPLWDGMSLEEVDLVCATLDRLCARSAQQAAHAPALPSAAVASAALRGAAMAAAQAQPVDSREGLVS